MKALAANRDFVLVAGSHSLAITYFYIFTTVLAQMVGVYRFTQTQASYLSTAYQISGILSGILCSGYLTNAGP